MMILGVYDWRNKHCDWQVFVYTFGLDDENWAYSTLCRWIEILLQSTSDIHLYYDLSVCGYSGCLWLENQCQYKQVSMYSLGLDDES